MFLLTAALWGCSAPRLPSTVTLAHAATGNGGAVASVERQASRVGARVLAAGGNAVDAAVATALALAVTWPPAGNLGGGGLMTLVTADGQAEVIDFRETAPAAVGEDLFLDRHGRYDPDLSEHPWRCAGVPGSVAGLWLAHQRHGELPWEHLVQPAVDLARDGFEVDAVLAAFFVWAAEDLKVGAPVFLDSRGDLFGEGALLRQPQLAVTLERLRDDGPASFYQGPFAQEFAAAIQAGGGFMSADDLRSYQAVLRSPLRIELGSAVVLAPPPPSAGGVFLAQMAGQLQRRQWAGLPLGSAAELHLWSEASRRAFAERARWLADPDHADVPTARLHSDVLIDALATSIDTTRVTASGALGPPLNVPESEQTTHISVMDDRGGAVSLTTTLESAFGARVTVGNSGVLLNNQLRDFNRAPGLTSAEGLVGTTPNLGAPGKRPLTSMTPVIALDSGGRPVLVTGSPGGRTIVSTVTRITLDVLLLGASLDAAVSAPRVHHGWFPDRIDFEPGTRDPAVLAELTALGHDVLERPTLPPLFGTQGAAHSVVALPDGRQRAVGDPRRKGWAAVVDR